MADEGGVGTRVVQSVSVQFIPFFIHLSARRMSGYSLWGSLRIRMMTLGCRWNMCSGASLFPLLSIHTLHYLPIHPLFDIALRVF
jgi:hypothetical protein